MSKITLKGAMRAHNSVTARRRSLDMYGSGLRDVSHVFRDEINEIRQNYDRMQNRLELIEIEI